MFEEQYRKYCGGIKPSEALNEETLALMQEARDHRSAPTPAPLRWKPALVLPIAATAAAAAVALVITGVWLTRGNGDLLEEAGDMDIAFDESPILGDSTADDTEDYDSAIKDYLEQNKPTAKPDNGAANNSVGGSTGTGNSGSSTDSDSFDDAGSNSQPGTSAPPADPNEENNDLKAESTEPALPTDPYGPEISQEKNIKTYLSFREFIDALAKKETPGYGSNYYNARELLIMPNLLPDGARFRHLHLNTKNGKYSYSYYFTKDKKDYIIDIDVNAVTPKNLNELRLFKEHAAEEKILTAKEGDRLYYQFGEQDIVTVTLTDVTATDPLTAEDTAALLTQFRLERCSLLNPTIDMKY